MLVRVCTQICFKPKQVNSWNECFDEVEGGAKHRDVLGHMTILWWMESSVCCTPPVSVLLCILRPQKLYSVCPPSPLAGELEDVHVYLSSVTPSVLVLAGRNRREFDSHSDTSQL